MHIPDPDAGTGEIIRQILGHFLGEGGDQRPVVLRRQSVDLADQVVHLALHRPDLHLRVQKARGPQQLLGHLAGPAQLILRRGGGHIDHLMDLALELVKLQGPVVVGGGKPEPVIHQGRLSGPVAVVHGPYLGHRHVALVDEHEEVLREIVHQRHGRRARRTAADDPGVVLDAGAEAQLVHHLDVVHGPLADALGLEQLAVVLEPLLPVQHFLPDLPGGPLHLFLCGDVVAGGIDGAVAHLPLRGAGDHVELADPVDLVPEELDADGPAGPSRREHLHRVPPDPEGVADEVQVVALIPDVDEAPQQSVPLPGLALPDGHHQRLIVLRIPQTVDTAHGSHHDHVPPLQQGGGGGVPQPVDLVIGGGVLFDVGVRVGDVGLRLIVVVVGDEVFHGVLREKLLELRAELGGQGLVVGQHQGGPVHLCDDVGHGEGLAGAGDAQEHLFVNAVLKARGQGFDGLRLIARGLEGCVQFKNLLHSAGPPLRRDAKLR